MEAKNVKSAVACRVLDWIVQLLFETVLCNKKGMQKTFFRSSASLSDDLAM